MRKTYETIYSSYSALYRVKDKMIRVFFSGGYRNGYGVRSSAFTTDNVDLQESIESSDDFIQGRVFLSAKTKKDIDKTRKYDIVTSTAPSNEYTEVTSVEQAVKILTSEPYNFEKKDVNTRAKIFSVAKTLEITFPNL